MNALTKRRISFAILGLGIALGIYGCVAVPKAVFVIGDNDSTAEIWAIALCPTTLLPVCVLALWKRVIAGIWLFLLSVLWTFAIFAQNHYLRTARHFPGATYGELLTSDLLPAYLFMGLSIFCLLSNYFGWPNVFSQPLLRHVESTKTP